MPLRNRKQALSYLELPGDCWDDDAIKRAYKKQALKWHPDKNGGSAESAQRFKNINEAFHFIHNLAPGAEEYPSEEDSDYCYESCSDDEFGSTASIPSFKSFFETMFGMYSNTFAYDDIPSFVEGSDAGDAGDEADPESEFYARPPKDNGYTESDFCDCRHCRRARKKEEKAWAYANSGPSHGEGYGRAMDDEELLEDLRRHIEKTGQQAQEREASKWEKQMPRPTLVTKTARSITLNLARGKAISQTIPEDCTLEVWMRQDGPGHAEWSQSDASRVGKTMVLVSGLAPGTSYHFRSRAGRVAGNWAGAPMRWSAFSVESTYATSGTAPKAQPPQPPPATRAPQPPAASSASPSAAAKDSAESEAGLSGSGKFDSKAKTKGKGKKAKGRKPFDADLEIDVDQEAKIVSPKKSKNSTPIWELVAKAEEEEAAKRDKLAARDRSKKDRESKDRAPPVPAKENKDAQESKSKKRSNQKGQSKLSTSPDASARGVHSPARSACAAVEAAESVLGLLALDQDGEEWSCQFCTLRNPGGVEVCECCGTSRWALMPNLDPDAPRPPRAAAGALTQPPGQIAPARAPDASHLANAPPAHTSHVHRPAGSAPPRTRHSQGTAPPMPRRPPPPPGPAPLFMQQSSQQFRVYRQPGQGPTPPPPPPLPPPYPSTQPPMPRHPPPQYHSRAPPQPPPPLPPSMHPAVPHLGSQGNAHNLQSKVMDLWGVPAPPPPLPPTPNPQSQHHQSIQQQSISGFSQFLSMDSNSGNTFGVPHAQNNPWTAESGMSQQGQYTPECKQWYGGLGSSDPWSSSYSSQPAHLQAQNMTPPSPMQHRAGAQATPLGVPQNTGQHMHTGSHPHLQQTGLGQQLRDLAQMQLNSDNQQTNTSHGFLLDEQIQSWQQPPCSMSAAPPQSIGTERELVGVQHPHSQPQHHGLLSSQLPEQSQLFPGPLSAESIQAPPIGASQWEPSLPSRTVGMFSTLPTANLLKHAAFSAAPTAFELPGLLQEPGQRAFNHNSQSARAQEDDTDITAMTEQLFADIWQPQAASDVRSRVGIHQPRAKTSRFPFKLEDSEEENSAGIPALGVQRVPSYFEQMSASGRIQESHTAPSTTASSSIDPSSPRRTSKFVSSS